MRALVVKVIFILLLIGTKGFSQSVYYGYPPKESTLKHGDLIMLNLPQHLHSKFTFSEQISNLEEFISSHADMHFTIEIHVYIDSPEYDMKLSEHLKKSLVEMLASNIVNTNYGILAKGSTIPIFTQKENTLFRKFNTRLQVLVE